jgi:hypothetical protein
MNERESQILLNGELQYILDILSPLDKVNMISEVFRTFRDYEKRLPKGKFYYINETTNVRQIRNISDLFPDWELICGENRLWNEITVEEERLPEYFINKEHLMNKLSKLSEKQDIIVYRYKLDEAQKMRCYSRGFLIEERSLRATFDFSKFTQYEEKDNG